MHNQYVVRTGGKITKSLTDLRIETGYRNLRIDTASGRIELTWNDDSPDWELPEKLRPQGMPRWERYQPIYEQKLVIELVIERRPSLKVTFSEGLDRKLNNTHFQYAEEQGWPYDKKVLFAETDHTWTWTDGRQIRLTSGEWGKSVNEMQLVVYGENAEIVTISDRFKLANALKRELAKLLTQVLQLRHAEVGMVDQYTVD